MMKLNQLFLDGKIGGVPELRYSKNGVAVTTLTIVWEKAHKDSNREWIKSEVLYLNAVAFKEVAEYIAQNFSEKWQGITVCGRLVENIYTDKEGRKHYNKQLFIQQVLEQKEDGTLVELIGEKKYDTKTDDAKTDGEATL